MNVPRGSVRSCWILGILLAAWTVPTHAAINENQALVVYNSASTDATALLADYLAAHPGIPTANLVDLNDASLLVADISYADFVSKIRNPIRDYLSAPGAPQPEDIVAIALLRPIPHRVLDTDNSAAGDNASAMQADLVAGDATAACVDSELALLWQNLDAGEAGGQMDSLSDNVIDNPYHTSIVGIDTFSRANITSAKTFANAGNAAWLISGSGATQLTPGDIYLVCRVDGTTLADASAIIDRAADNRVNRKNVRALFDEFDVSTGADYDDDPLFGGTDPFLAGDDYEETTAELQAAGWDVRYDGTADFIDSTEETATLIAYASYGENHDAGGHGDDPPGSGSYINGFNFSDGAIFNTIESFNGRAFNGLGTRAGQEQVADFITAGGTYAVGNVFEPFTFSVADNEFLVGNLLLHGQTFAEAAYASMPVLSWQQVAVGDPLGRVWLLGDVDGDGDIDTGDVGPFTECLNGPDLTMIPFGCPQDAYSRADIDQDGDVDLADYAMLQCLAGM